MRIPRSLIALPVTLALGLSPVGTSAVADPPGPADPPGSKASLTGQDHRAQQADDALAEVQAILDGRRAGQRGRTTDGRSLTVALRDLKVLKDALPAHEEAQVDRILQRPGDPCGSCNPDDNIDNLIDEPLPQSACQGVICVHYTTTGNHAPDLTDGGDAGSTPDYIDEVLRTVRQVHADYVAAGYRRPKPDGSIGSGSNVVDIYIGDIGDAGLYGYCTSDDPHDPFDANDPGYLDFSFWAYCTLDDDYESGEFPTNTPLENMRVTAAHEYFHAVQFAYDAYEDGWILESTATWVEDEMFDGVDDNRNYFSDSPLTKPGRSIDQFGGLFHYGVWIWWRYLTEKFGAKTGKLPTLVLDVWKRLDARPGAPDDYSTQALTRVLASRGTTLKKEFQLFSAANRHPRTVYDEGAAYPVAPATPVGITPAKPRWEIAGRFSHLSSGTAQLNPRNLGQRDWKLRLNFNLPPTARGAAAVVVVYKRSGGITTNVMRLNRTGAGTKTVAFSSRTIRKVDVVLVNTSARFTQCFQQSTPYSCSGVPSDQNLRFAFVAKAFRS